MRACPRLSRVRFVAEFTLESYGSTCNHCADLVQHGAGMLQCLELVGDFLAFSVSYMSAIASVRGAFDRIRGARPVPSETLREYHMTRQVPMPVDSPVLTTLVIDEAGQDPVLGRMGPRTMAACRELRLHASRFDTGALALAAYSNLRALDVTIASRCASHVSKCFAALRHLPPRLETLRVNVDTWRLVSKPMVIEWPNAALSHLACLRDVSVEMDFPPDNVGALFGHWMGAPNLSAAKAIFERTVDECYAAERDALWTDGLTNIEDDAVAELLANWRSASSSICPAPAAEWLNAHPAATVTLHNCQTLDLVHPRLVLTRTQKRPWLCFKCLLHASLGPCTCSPGAHVPVM